MVLSGTRGIARVFAAAALALSAAAAPSAAGARDLSGVPDGLGEQVESRNFAVHYTSAPGDPNAIVPDAAQQLAETAERALSDSKGRLDLPQPRDDGDGRADIYVFQAGSNPERGMVRPDSRADQTTGWIAVPPDATGDIVTVAHMVVHLQQLGLYRPAGGVLAEGSATWAPLYLYAGEVGRLPDHAQFFPDDPLDCTDERVCGRPGYGAWQFFELLAERHGPQVVRALYDRSSTLGASDHGPHFREALQDELRARGTTLAATFALFTAANLVGDYKLPGLARRRYGATEPFDDRATGTRARRTPAQAVTLDHLSAAFYRVRSGSDLSQAARRKRCRPARLRVTIDGPSGLEAPLYWAPFRPRRGAARAIALTKGRAVIDRPWSTCGGRELGIALHNPSASVDDRTFTVRVRLVL
jgi:hypothetical protein